ncbi:MAG: LysM peptidoglycan-binding domain-containing protein, partial [Myxococcota bacterium]
MQTFSSLSSARLPRLGGVGLAAALVMSAPLSEAWAQTVEGEPAPGVAGLGDAHAVRQGDTLWDLCAKYLNSPWYWPKIWSYNPQLTNPHWI